MKLSVYYTGLFILAVLAWSPASAAETRLIDFKFEDQFGHVHTREGVAGKIVFLIGGDGSGGPDCRAWTEVIEGKLSGHANYTRVAKLGYADLREVPFFLKRWARSKFPKEPDEWAMMDWRGQIAKAYDFPSGRCNILIFAPDGRLARHAAVNKIDPGKLKAVVGTMKGLLDAKTAQ